MMRYPCASTYVGSVTLAVDVYQDRGKTRVIALWALVAPRHRELHPSAETFSLAGPAPFTYNDDQYLPLTVGYLEAVYW